jgi:hypothetical protein
VTIGEARKDFFFEKRNKKLLLRFARHANNPGGASTDKSFLVLFFKKELLPFSPIGHQLRSVPGCAARIFPID